MRCFPTRSPTLRRERGARVIHISTDAVFSGRHARQPYTETDRAGSGRRLRHDESTRRDVLRRECAERADVRSSAGTAAERGLVEWYCGTRPSRSPASSDYVWTPVTTVQFADACAELIGGGFESLRAGGPVAHFAPNPPCRKQSFSARRARRGSAGSGYPARPVRMGPMSRVLVVADGPRLASDAVSGGDWPTVVAEMLAEFSIERCVTVHETKTRVHSWHPSRRHPRRAGDQPAAAVRATWRWCSSGPASTIPTT